MALEYLITNFGADHVLMGGDYPYEMGDPQPFESVNKTNISQADKQKVVTDNARRLLKIKA